MKIFHWVEALDLSIHRGCKKALMQMIVISEGISRTTTWTLAIRIAATKGKEDILAILLGHQKQSKNQSQKGTDKGKTTNQRSGPKSDRKAITVDNRTGRRNYRSTGNVATED